MYQGEIFLYKLIIFSHSLDCLEWMNIIYQGEIFLYILISFSHSLDCLEGIKISICIKEKYFCNSWFSFIRLVNTCETWEDSKVERALHVAYCMKNDI